MAQRQAGKRKSGMSIKSVKAALCVLVLAPPVWVWADCPEGARSTTPDEQRTYLAEMAALKAALPAAPTGWQVDGPALLATGPTMVCKGSKAVAGYDATYTSLEIRKQNQEREKQFESRMNALRVLPPDKQKEADDLYRQGSQLGYKSIAELKNKNQAEADRLRAEANKLYAESKAIRAAHLDSVSAQIRAVGDEQRASYVNPDVRVHLLVREEAGDWNASGSERAEIAGISKAYFVPDHALILFLGRVAAGHPAWARLEGNRAAMEGIARLFSQSGAKELSAKSGTQ